MPSLGPAAQVYDLAARHLKLDAGRSQRLALYAGSELIERHRDLAEAPIADGVILSAYCNWPLPLGIWVNSLVF